MSLLATSGRIDVTAPRPRKRGLVKDSYLPVPLRTDGPVDTHPLPTTPTLPCLVTEGVILRSLTLSTCRSSARSSFRVEEDPKVRFWDRLELL